MNNFAHKLLVWYQANQRKLPWRLTKEPYKIWISEIMLQQTKVKTVEPYFLRFLEKFPTVEALAKAEEQELFKCWEGLGFYRRAQNMHKTAAILYSIHHSHFPDDYNTLLSFPGIGAYTAAAICSIAFEQRKAVLDGNVMRIIARQFAIEKNILDTKTHSLLMEKLLSLFPDAQFGDFNQAMMELGSLICTPKTPKCTICPVASSCLAKAKEMQQNLPIREKNQKKQVCQRYVFMVEHQQKYLLRMRPSSGLLANFWEFPGVEAENLKAALAFFEKMFGVRWKNYRFQFSYQHIFSHRIWKMRVYKIHLNLENGSYFSLSELENIALPSAFKKIREFVLNN